MENPQKHNQQTTNNNKFTSLPIELQHAIFCRLPSKRLHICKSVSKEWLSIITSQEFIHFHLRLRSLSSLPRTHRLLVLNSLFDLSTLELDNDDDDTLEPTISKHSSILLPSDYSSLLKFVGTCNGLVCIVEESLGTSNDRLYVYNPFTRRAWTVHVPTFQDSSSCLYGFGYDSATDDYKIMRITTSPHNPNIIEAHLFSFRSWSWKRINDFNHKLDRTDDSISRPCMFIGGYLHWIIVVEGSNCHGSTGIRIIRFDVSREDYSLMELPPVLSNAPWELSSADGTGLGHVELEIFDGCLCLQVMNYSKHNFDVWVMGEYDVSLSWKHLFRIGYSTNSSICHFWMKALAYSTTGDRVLVLRGSLRGTRYYWYDTEGKEQEYLGYKNSRNVSLIGRFYGSIVCAGSLISPICGDI